MAVKVTNTVETTATSGKVVDAAHVQQDTFDGLSVIGNNGGITQKQINEYLSDGKEDTIPIIYAYDNALTDESPSSLLITDMKAKNLEVVEANSSKGEFLCKIKVGVTTFYLGKCNTTLESTEGDSIIITAYDTSIGDGVLTAHSYTMDSSTGKVTVNTTEFSGGGNSYDVATDTSDGLMSAADKTKLDGIGEGAEENQNTFQKVEVTNGDTPTTITAVDKADTLELVAGDGISLEGDADGRSVTIKASVALVTLTQDEYDALTTKDENTFYIIKG